MTVTCVCMAFVYQPKQADADAALVYVSPPPPPALLLRPKERRKYHADEHFLKTSNIGDRHCINIMPQHIALPYR